MDSSVTIAATCSTRPAAAPSRARPTRRRSSMSANDARPAPGVDVARTRYHEQRPAAARWQVSGSAVTSGRPVPRITTSLATSTSCRRSA
jgi:hypothetical protein